MPDEKVLEIYNSLRPFRCTKAELESIAVEPEADEFFDRLTTIGFNMDGDDRMKLDPSQLPVKPEGCEDQVVWKHGVESDPAIDDRN